MSVKSKLFNKCQSRISQLLPLLLISNKYLKSPRAHTTHGSSLPCNERSADIASIQNADNVLTHAAFPQNPSLSVTVCLSLIASCRRVSHSTTRTVATQLSLIIPLHPVNPRDCILSLIGQNLQHDVSTA